MKQKPLFWQSGVRRLMFILGAIAVIGGIGYITFNVLVVSGWKSAPITSVQPLGAGCSRGQQQYTITYIVNERDYTMHTCDAVEPTVTTLQYNPSDPSIAILNSPIVNEVLGGMIAVVGAIFMVGAAFARDAKPGELGYQSPVDGQTPSS